MSLAIPNKKQAVKAPRKSVVSELATLKDEGLIETSTFEFFVDKINEAGELNLSMAAVQEKEKNVKAELIKSPAYQKKIQVAKMKKYVKAMQEKNLDETNGALELIVQQLGPGKAQSIKNLLTE